MMLKCNQIIPDVPIPEITLGHHMELFNRPVT